MFKAISLRDLFEDKYRPLAMLGCSTRSFAEHRTTINRWRAFLGRDPLVSELEDERVALFLEWVAARRSPATVEKHRRNLSALAKFSAHRKRRYIDEPLDIPRIRCPEREPLAWSEPEIVLILEQAAALKGEICGIERGRWWEALLVLIYYCGTRIDATMRLKWQDVYLHERYALFRADTQKQKKDQPLAYPDFAVERLKAIRWPERELVFPWPYDQNADNWQTLRRHYTRYILIPCGLPTDGQSKFHRIRKTAATVTTDHVGEQAAVNLMGHSSPAITRKSYIQRTKLRAARSCDLIPTPRYQRPGPEQRLLFPT